MSGGDWKEMYAAALAGDEDLLGYHLRNGIDPNYQHPEFMCTALVGAILAGQHRAAALLLAHGAAPGLVSETDGLTPLQAAQRSGDARWQALLLPHAGQAAWDAAAAPARGWRAWLQRCWPVR